MHVLIDVKEFELWHNGLFLPRLVKDLWNGPFMAARINGKAQGPRCLLTAAKIVQATRGVCENA